MDIPSQSATFSTMKFLSNSEELKCSKCGELVTSAEALRRHISARHLEWTPWHCPHCSVYAPIESLLVQHLRNSHAELDHWIKYCPNPNKAKSLDSAMNRSIGLSVKRSSKAKTAPSSAVEGSAKVLKSSPEINTRVSSPKNLSHVSCKVCHQSVLPSNMTAHIASEHLHQPLFLCSATECSEKRFFSAEFAKFHASKAHGRQDVIRESGLASRSQLRTWWKRCFADSGASKVECRCCGLLFHAPLQKRINGSRIKSARFRCPQCKHSSKWNAKTRPHQQCVYKSRVGNDRERDDCKLGSGDDGSGIQSDNRIVAAKAIDVSAPRKTPLPVSIADDDCSSSASKAKAKKTDTTKFLSDSLSPVECGACGKMCTNRVDFDKHVLQSHWTRPLYRCPFCSFRSKFLDQVDRHIPLAHSDRDYEQPDDLDENQLALKQYLQTMLC